MHYIHQTAVIIIDYTSFNSMRPPGTARYRPRQKLRDGRASAAAAGPAAQVCARSLNAQCMLSDEIHGGRMLFAELLDEFHSSNSYIHQVIIIIIINNIL